MAVADYKLTDLLGAAGATTGIIIAGVLLLQFLSAKYGEVCGRYRDVAQQYRGLDGHNARHSQLQYEIQLCRIRLWLLNRASWLAGMALLGFILAVMAGGLSMAFPHVVALSTFGSLCLLVGLILIGGGVALEVWDSALARHEIGPEVADLDRDAQREAQL